MITVKIVRDNQRQISGLFMNGHAGYAEAGQDIVCAGASVLVYTAINALEAICGLDNSIANISERSDGSVSAEIVLPDINDQGTRERAQVILETAAIGYRSLAMSVNEDGNQYIRIVEDN